MSWLGSFGVLPSPNHVLAKLAIFRGAEPSPHSPRATDSAAVFYYYFKPFAVPPPSPPPPTPFPIRTPLVRQFHPLVLLTTSARYPPTIQPPSLSPPFQDGPLTTSPRLLASPPSRLVPSGGDENFQTPRDRNRIVISRGSRPCAIRRPDSLFLLRPWRDAVATTKVPETSLLPSLPYRFSAMRGIDARAWTFIDVKMITFRTLLFNAILFGTS